MSDLQETQEPLEPLEIETPEEIINGLPECARTWARSFLEWLATSREDPAPCWLDKFSHSLGIPFCTAVEKKLCDASGTAWELWPHADVQKWMTREELDGAAGYCKPSIF
jgi:hypothetical protein